MTKQQLIEENLNLVYHLIHRHYPTFANDEDIVQVGMLGLCKAADKWDESKSAFTTYAGKCILNEINGEFRNRKKHNGLLSLDYEVTDSDGEHTTFGDFVVGAVDVDYVDIEPLCDRLSEIERKIFNMKQSGMSSQDIADKLGCRKSMVQRKLRKIKYLWWTLDEQ